MTKFTFEMFQATRRWSDNLKRDVPYETFEPAAATPRGWVYLDGLIIDEVLAHWPDEARKEGKWHLLIERDEYITNDLESLERKLFDWAFGDCPAYSHRAEPLDWLIDEYQKWNEANGLNLGSADEHAFDENLTEAQRKYIADFSMRWECICNLIAEQDAIERRAHDEGLSR